MGDNDAETLSNVTVGDFDYEDDSFEGISEDAKDFIDHLLVKDKRYCLLLALCYHAPKMSLVFRLFDQVRHKPVYAAIPSTNSRMGTADLFKNLPNDEGFLGGGSLTTTPRT